MVFNSVVKEIYFENLQDIIATSIRDVAKLLSHKKPRS